MPSTPSNAIWVFIDLRSRRLLGFSLNILCKGRQLAASTGGRVVAVLLTPPGGAPLNTSEGDACVLTESAETSCLSHGADQVLVLENDQFESHGPTCSQLRWPTPLQPAGPDWF